VAVVGPSGAGKDAVIGCARERLRAEDAVLFPRRVITRAPGAGEDHLAVTPEEFHALSRTGGFALQWAAHGLWYGVPRFVAGRVAAGEVAVVNVSRMVLDDLDAVFGRVRVVRVTVPDDVRRARILARGREIGPDVRARLDRPDPAPDHPVDLEIVNDGRLEDAGERLVSLVAGVLPAPAQPRV